MTDTPVPAETRDYRDTVFLPRTDFPMKAGLSQKEPAILAKWLEQDLEGQIRESRKDREQFILHDGPPYANGDMPIGHRSDKRRARNAGVSTCCYRGPPDTEKKHNIACAEDNRAYNSIT